MMPEDATQPSLPFEGPPAVEGPAPVPVKESQLWTWTDLVLYLTSAALTFLAASFLVTFAYLAVLTMAGLPQPKAGQVDPLYSISIEAVWYGLWLACVYFLLTAYHGRPFWSSLKLRRPSIREGIVYTVGGFVMAVGVQLAPTLLPDKDTFPLEKMLSTPLAAYALGAFAVLVAPFIEELFFRGILFSVLEKRANVVFAMVVTAMLFGAAHIPEYQGAWNHILLLFVVGGIFSLTRGLTGSLTPGIILHMAYNLSLMAGFLIETQYHGFKAP